MIPGVYGVYICIRLSQNFMYHLISSVRFFCKVVVVTWVLARQVATVLFVCVLIQNTNKQNSRVSAYKQRGSLYIYIMCLKNENYVLVICTLYGKPTPPTWVIRIIYIYIGAHLFVSTHSDLILVFWGNTTRH